ncbi:uncharacterized protein C10orf67 homolog, mitochondrial [Elgaria multicarinata webbii]|uniref:uncharacterized protein C10orf67 homolog, mitochondrial n=1 Tax=Elgaria multicarinata webbii TaxID=159646 RepID=UPI002FCCEF45
MAKAISHPASVYHSREQDDMGATARARAQQSTRKLSISPNILELLTVPCCLEELEVDYRPRISEDLKIGSAISDQATQTDVSEIGDLKEFIITTRTLLKFTNSIYDDFAMYKNVLKTQYEEKIHEQASNLWLEISDRLKHIEDFYKQKEVKIRQSYQQQLCDALAILKSNYAKHFHTEVKISAESEESIAAKIGRLRNKIEEQAATIESLEGELQQQKEREKIDGFLIFQLPYDRDIETELLQQENREFKEQMASQLGKFARLQETLKRKEKEHTDLETEMKHMQDKKERDMNTIEKLLNTQEILKLELDREKQRVLSKAREVKEAQDTVAKLTGAVAHTVPKVPSVHEPKPGKGGKKLKGKAAKEAIARAAIARVASTREATAREDSAKQKRELGQDPAAEKKALLDEIKKLKKAEHEAKLHVQRLEQELRQSGRSWQLKFEILKKSMHALKDEMFLRQSLRQSTKFRRPSLVDRTAAPLHIQNQNIPKSFSSSLFIQYAPLPDISSQISISSQTAIETDENFDLSKIPVTIEIPRAYEGESVDEEDFDELPHLPSPLSSVP